MNTILEEALIAICDKTIEAYSERELEFAVLKFWYASEAKSPDVFQKSKRPQGQADIKEFWGRFHDALSRFLNGNETCFKFDTGRNHWEQHFFGEIEAARVTFEARKVEVIGFMQDQQELMRWDGNILRPSVGALQYDFA